MRIKLRTGIQEKVSWEQQHNTRASDADYMIFSTQNDRRRVLRLDGVYGPQFPSPPRLLRQVEAADRRPAWLRGLNKCTPYVRNVARSIKYSF